VVGTDAAATTAANVVDAGGYDVLIGAGLLARTGDIAVAAAPAHRYAIVTDAHVGPLYAAAVQRVLRPGASEVFTIAAGEHAKTRETWQFITDQLLARGFGRDTTVLALGGGVVGDLAGFVAATFMRGVPVVQIPTTLLAMIDASIGGKTGVDTPAGKNLVGAFHAPRAVVCDPQVLATLDVPQLRSGLAEALKHGAIADRAYFLALAERSAAVVDPDSPSRDNAFITGVIHRSVQIKARVTREDPREQGVRKTLNFGHTVGHAIELLSGFSLRHGEAVAIGMVLEARAGERAGITEPGTSDTLAAALERAGLPVVRPAGPTPDAVIATMRGDKKARGGALAYAIPIRIGEMAGATTGFAVPLDDRLMLEVLA